MAEKTFVNACVPAFGYVMKNFLYLLFSLYLFVFQLHSVAVQASGKVPTKSLELTLRDTTKKIKDSLKTLQPRRDIETTVSYQAKDSIRFKVREQMIYMFGSSKVVYGKIALEAETIDMNWKTNLVRANGKLDTTTNKMIGQPVFTDQGQKYNIDAMTYNFKTKKGVITGIRTKQDEGFVVGGRVKKMPENEMFVNRGIYTTCDLPHPHYGIRARKMKVIPEKATVTGPFNLEIENVPLPLGFLFGMFPQPNRKRSGLVFPQYGETQTNGFFLQDGGLYVTIKDRFDIALLGEIHSKGRWGLRMPINYAKRYAYTGNLNLSLLRSFQEVDGRTTPTATTDFRVTWSHTPQTRGTGRFSANVNFGTNSSTRNMMLPGGNPQSFLQSSINSNINYSKTLGIFSFGIAVPYNQNIITKIITITPNANISMNRVYPFKSLAKPGSKSLLAQLNIGYNGTVQSNFSNLVPRTVVNNVVRNDTVSFEPANFNRIFNNSQISAKHNVPISTATTIAKYFTLSLNFNYSETWYLERYQYGNGTVNLPRDTKLDNYRFNTGGNIKIDTIKELSRMYDYSTSANVNTRLYATYFMKGRVEAIRHTMAPNIGFSYTPDFGAALFGFYQLAPTDSTGLRYQKRSVFPTFAGTPRQGMSGSIAFGLDNQLEMKLRPRESDTVKTSRKITLIDNIGIQGSYNLAADSMRLSPIGISARTTLLKKVNVNITASLDPYAYVSAPVRTNDTNQTPPDNQINPRTVYPPFYRSKHYAWEKGQGIGNLTNVTIGFGTNLNPKAASKQYKAKTPDQQNEVDFINRNRHLYIDFEIPWSLNVNYNLNYSKMGYADAQITQTMNFNGDFSLTKKWKVTYTSGWDFKANELTFTQFTIARDLHCWQMNVTWIPFGPRTGFTLDINVKAATLRDLKLSRRNNWYYR